MSTTRTRCVSKCELDSVFNRMEIGVRTVSIPVVFGANNTHLLYRFILLFLLIYCSLQTQDLGNAVTTYLLINHSLPVTDDKSLPTHKGRRHSLVSCWMAWSLRGSETTARSWGQRHS